MRKELTDTVKKIAPYVVAAGLALSSTGCMTSGGNYTHLAVAPGNVQYSSAGNGQRFRATLDEQRGNRFNWRNGRNSLSVRTRGSGRRSGGSSFGSAYNPSNY